MEFILNDDAFLEKLKFTSLKDSYEGKAKAKLSDPSPSSIFTSLGYKDTSRRNVQIKALAWLYKHLEGDLNIELSKSETVHLKNVEAEKGVEEVTVELNKVLLEKQNRRIQALRVLTGACIYIIEKNSTGVLVDMLKEYLGVNSANEIDSKTRNYCFLAIKEHFERIGEPRSYGEYDLKGIDFDFFTKLYASAEKEVNKSIIDDFPFAKLTSLTFAWPMSMVGYSVGAMAGQAISHSTTLQNTQWRLTALIGGTIYYIMGPTAGITLLAPTIASQALTNMCGLSAAYGMGKVGEYLGLILGAAVGLPIDMSWKFARAFGAMVLSFVWSKSNGPLPEKGISLVDASLYLHGEKFEMSLKTDEELAKLGAKPISTDSLLNDSDILKEIEDSKLIKELQEADIIKGLQKSIAEKLVNDLPKTIPNIEVNAQEAVATHTI